MKTFRLLRLDHLVIDTRNLQRSLDFYAKFPGVDISVEKGRGVARIGRQKINIHEYPPTLFPVASRPVTGHQAFGLEFPGTFDRFRASFPFPAERGPHGGTKDFFVKDPDGNRIEIRFAPASPRPRIRYLALLAADREASLRFYSQILGLEVAQCENGALCRLGTGHLRLVAEDGELAGGAADFCLITDADIAAVEKELAGAPFVPGLGIVGRHGALGPMRSVYLRDPGGNLVEIAEYGEKRGVS